MWSLKCVFKHKCIFFVIIDEYVSGQRSIQEHVWPSEVTMNKHEVRGWDFSLAVKTQLKVTHAPELASDLMQTHRDLTGWRHTQSNFEPVLIFIDLAQLHFCLDYKNSHWTIIDCHISVNLYLAKDKMLIYLINKECWPNTLFFLIKSHFSNCILLLDTPYTLYILVAARTILQIVLRVLQHKLSYISNQSYNWNSINFRPVTRIAKPINHSCVRSLSQRT